MHDTVTDAVVRALDAAADDIAELTAELVRAASVTGDEGAVAGVVAARLDEFGLAPKVDHVPEHYRASLPPEFAGEQGLAGRPNVYGWLRSSDPGARSRPSLVLNGHLDVVPAGDPDRWSVPPFGGLRRDGKVWGRGAADMKGPIAAAMITLRTLREHGVVLPFDVQLQCVIAEESTSLGTLYALDSQPRPGAAIVLEPSANTVVPAGGGSLQFTITTRGTAAHGAVPWTGATALDPLLACYRALQAYADRRNAEASHPLFAELPQAAPFAVGTISAGDWRVMLPETGEFSGRLGLLPGESISDLRDELGAVIDAAAAADSAVAAAEPQITWPNAGFPAWETPVDHPLVQALADGCEAVTGERRVGAVTFGADAGHFAAAGIPVALFGPGRIEVAHMADEHIDEGELVTASHVLATTLIGMEQAA